MLTKIMQLNLRLLAKPFLAPRFSVAFQRRWASMLMLLNQNAGGTSFDLINMNGVPARLIRTTTASDRAVLYLHGGAYVLGDPKSHRGLCSHLARFSDARVYTVDYRLAPEHPYPAALEDALTAYRWLLGEGFSADQISIAGDSAGGGLATAIVCNIRDQGLPMPGKLLLISPFVDMTLSGESMQSHADADPMLRQDWLRSSGDFYRGETPADHPDCSPLFADLKGFPPTLIHVGSEEVLLDDAKRLTAALQAAGAQVTLRVFEGYWHDFQLQAGLVPMANDSLAGFADFLSSS